MATPQKWIAATALLFLFFSGFFIVSATSPEIVLKGQVVDEAGNPIEGVTVQLSGIEKFRDGAWVRELRLGIMPSFQTDADGRFLLPFEEKDVRYDLWFDRIGWAPTFISGISATSSELEVTLERGMVLTGKVTRQLPNKTRGDRPGPEVPVQQTVVDLRLPSEDLWYQQRSFTDAEGRYSFRVSPPPPGREWQVVFAGEVVPLEIEKEKPIEGPDFLIEVSVYSGSKRRLRRGGG